VSKQLAFQQPCWYRCAIQLTKVRFTRWLRIVNRASNYSFPCAVSPSKQNRGIAGGNCFKPVQNVLQRLLFPIDLLKPISLRNSSSRYRFLLGELVLEFGNFSYAKAFSIARLSGLTPGEEIDIFWGQRSLCRARDRQGSEDSAAIIHSG